MKENPLNDLKMGIDIATLAYRIGLKNCYCWYFGEKEDGIIYAPDFAMKIIEQNRVMNFLSFAKYAIKNFGKISPKEQMEISAKMGKQ